MAQTKSFSQSLSYSAASPFKQQVQSIYQKLNAEIDSLSIKVYQMISKHESEFVIAYQTHMKHIRRELELLKRQADQQEQEIRGNERIIYLEKQTAMFRAEALGLYDKLTDANQEGDLLRTKNADLEAVNKIMQKEIRQAMKSKKAAQVKLMEAEATLAELKKQLQEKKDQVSLSVSKNSRPPMFRRLRGQSLSIDFKQKSERSSHSLSKSMQTHSKRRSVLLVDYSRDNQLKQWFLECIRAVKREVATRKRAPNSLNLSLIKSIEEFKMIDKLKLLELFLESEKLLVWMYQKIFPSRIDEVKQYLSHRKDPFVKNTTKQTLETSKTEHIEIENSSGDQFRPISKLQIRLPQMSGKPPNHGGLDVKRGKLTLSSS